MDNSSFVNRMYLAAAFVSSLAVVCILTRGLDAAGACALHVIYACQRTDGNDAVPALAVFMGNDNAVEVIVNGSNVVGKGIGGILLGGNLKYSLPDWLSFYLS